MKNNSSDDKRLILLIGGTSSYSKSFSTKRQFLESLRYQVEKELMLDELITQLLVIQKQYKQHYDKIKGKDKELYSSQVDKVAKQLTLASQKKKRIKQKIQQVKKFNCQDLKSLSEKECCKKLKLELQNKKQDQFRQILQKEKELWEQRNNSKKKTKNKNIKKEEPHIINNNYNFNWYPKEQLKEQKAISQKEVLSEIHEQNDLSKSQLTQAYQEEIKKIQEEDEKRNEENFRKCMEQQTISEKIRGSQMLKLSQNFYQRFKNKNKDNPYASQDYEPLKYISQIVDYSVQLNSETSKLILLELLSSDSQNYECIKEDFIKKFKNNQIDGINLSSPQSFIQLFVFIYMSSGIYRKLNKDLINFSQILGPQIIKYVREGLKIFLLKQQYRQFYQKIQIVYRGVRSQIIEKQNMKYIYYGFTSTSTNLKKAKEFHQQKLNKGRIYKFILNPSHKNYIAFHRSMITEPFKEIFKGKPQYIQKQCEVLFLPCIQFLCVKISDEFVEMKQIKHQFPYKIMKQKSLFSAEDIDENFEISQTGIMFKKEQFDQKLYINELIEKDRPSSYLIQMKNVRDKMLKFGIIEKDKPNGKNYCEQLCKKFKNSKEIQITIDLKESIIFRDNENSKIFEKYEIRQEDSDKEFVPFLRFRNKGDQILLKRLH